jgi:hypothetical protein
MTQEAQYHRIPIENEPLLTDCGFAEFRLPLNGNATKMVLYNYKFKSMITYVDWDKHNSIDKAVKLLRDKLLDEQTIRDQRVIETLCTYFRNACILLAEDPSNEFFKNGNGYGGRKGKKHQEQQERQNKKTTEKQKEKKRVYVQKYHDGENLQAEAIIVGRKPYFAVAAPNVGNPDEVSIILQDSIPIDDKTILKPFEIAAYVNEPYSFKSEQEFFEFLKMTKDESLDSLYKKVKSIWRKYVDADDFHISICAADTIFTYFQDKIGLTHYLFFIGDNSSGKSNNLTVLHYIAYRNMMSSGMTAANVYQFLGSGEEGIGTICEDEADNIDEDREKMKVHKNGYTTGKYYHRTDTSVGRQQLKFNTFCFKAFAAEKLPDSVTAKGFNQRTIELPCVYGFPQYDISEVANPAGEEEYPGTIR